MAAKTMGSAAAAVAASLVWIAAGAGAADNVLWYRQPAARWTAALPLGNGRLGAMVFGGLPRERLQLNEESLWAGEPTDVYPPGFAANLRRVQQLVLEGRVLEAQQLGLETLTQSPTSYRSYEPLGDLWIEFSHEGKPAGYRRELNLADGVAAVEYEADGVRWRREAFISAVDDVLAVRLTARPAGRLRAVIRLTRPEDAVVRAAGPGRLHMDGQVIDVAAPEGYDDNPGGSGPGGAHMKFAARLLVRTREGTVRSAGDSLVVENAAEAVILLTAATDYNLNRMNFDRSIDPGATADRILEKASAKTWDQLLRGHLAEHRRLFGRVSLELGGPPRDDVPTDERLEAVKRGGEDPDLAALYFQYGRYLLMSSSRRPGRLPANLQGIWNDRMWAPWEADYHLNINLQMNYWPADLCNLPETMDPLVDWLTRLAEKGRVSARRLYGARGWVAYTTTNPFGRTTPGGSTKKSQFQNGVLDPLAGAWMAMTLWRHYEFTADRRFLSERAYPVLKGAAALILDLLVEDKDGRLVIAPSTSPENSYVDPVSGQALRITRGSTYHMSLVRVVFDAVIRASRLLDRDAELRERLEQALTRLPPIQIGGDGTIQEWIDDYAERDPGHRHMSHLLGLHPFALITPEQPELLEAARRTIERRLAHGGGHTGWSRAWIVNMYARLGDGDAARRHLLLLLRKSTLPNLMDICPPFQIDGNFGGCAGIAEMLVQSHAGVVHLLPALPTAWPNGSVRGLRARGGFVVDLAWRDGELASYRIEATRDAPLRLRAAGRLVQRRMKAGEVLERGSTQPTGAARRAGPPCCVTGTFSIVAVDPERGVCGAAVASKYPAVGRVVPYVRAGVGAFCTQHWGQPKWGERALDLLAAGKLPEEVLGELLRDDPQKDKRQLGIIDMAGRAANRNPVQADPSGYYWGAMSGRYYACQGNTLTGREVITAMARAYEETPGSLADRLMAALLAGDRAGGDHRGRLAAGIRVAKRGEPGYWLELYVDKSDNAVEELVQRYLRLDHPARGPWPGAEATESSP